MLICKRAEGGTRGVRRSKVDFYGAAEATVHEMISSLDPQAKPLVNDLCSKYEGQSVGYTWREELDTILAPLAGF